MGVHTQAQWPLILLLIIDRSVKDQPARVMIPLSRLQLSYSFCPPLSHRKFLLSIHINYTTHPTGVSAALTTGTASRYKVRGRPNTFSVSVSAPVISIIVGWYRGVVKYCFCAILIHLGVRLYPISPSNTSIVF